MMGSKSAVFYLVALLVLVNLTSLVVSECCGGGSLLNPFCADGTDGSLCCAYGPCNIFCCNCDGGCRGVGRKRGAEHHGESEKEVFAKMDTNGDGFVDKAEADAFALKNLHYNGTAQLASFDEGFKKIGKAKITLADLMR